MSRGCGSGCPRYTPVRALLIGRLNSLPPLEPLLTTPTSRGRQLQKLVFCGIYEQLVKFDTPQLHQFITRGYGATRDPALPSSGPSQSRALRLTAPAPRRSITLIGEAATLTEIQRADPVARRQALLIVMLGALVGTLLIIGFEHYRGPLRDWLLPEPGEPAHRLKLVLLLTTVILSAPLAAFAAYLWSLGSEVLRTQQFPPPRSRVIRDTPVIGGRAAILRGRSLRALALCLGVASALLWWCLWRLDRVIH